jgi:hypothetical protein
MCELPRWRGSSQTQCDVLSRIFRWGAIKPPKSRLETWNSSVQTPSHCGHFRTGTVSGMSIRQQILVFSSFQVSDIFIGSLTSVFEVESGQIIAHWKKCMFHMVGCYRQVQNFNHYSTTDLAMELYTSSSTISKVGALHQPLNTDIRSRNGVWTDSDATTFQNLLCESLASWSSCIQMVTRRWSWKSKHYSNVSDKSLRQQDLWLCLGGTSPKFEIILSFPQPIWTPYTLKWLIVLWNSNSWGNNVQP